VPKTLYYYARTFLSVRPSVREHTLYPVTSGLSSVVATYFCGRILAVLHMPAHK